MTTVELGREGAAQSKPCGEPQTACPEAQHSDGGPRFGDIIENGWPLRIIPRASAFSFERGAGRAA